jgi:hypothetical protein
MSESLWILATQTIMDWCDDGNGGVYISYSWSDHAPWDDVHGGAAEARNTTQRQWLESFFEWRTEH